MRGRVPVSILVLCDGEFHDGSVHSGKLLMLKSSLESLRLSSWYDFQTELVNLAKVEGFDWGRLEDYQQVWLFGAKDVGAAGAASPNVAALDAFMKQGKGVFATGDHGSLGAAMGGKVPGVRSMRSWRGGSEYAEYGAAAEAPTLQHSYTRVDTRTRRFMERPDDASVDQYDGEGKSVEPRFLEGIGYHPLFRRRLGGEAALGSMVGAAAPTIRHMGDHNHEGVCFDFEGRTPTQKNEDGDLEEDPFFIGQPAPEVVADAISRTGRVEATFYVVRKARRYGVVSVFDPKPREQRGRIVVDSTFHHWTELNLEELLTPSDPEQSPFALARQRRITPHIRDYWINVAEWLVPAAIERQALCKQAANVRESAVFADYFQDSDFDPLSAPDARQAEVVLRILLQDRFAPDVFDHLRVSVELMGVERDWLHRHVLAKLGNAQPENDGFAMRSLRAVATFEAYAAMLGIVLTEEAAQNRDVGLRSFVERGTDGAKSGNAAADELLSALQQALSRVQKEASALGPLLNAKS